MITLHLAIRSPGHPAPQESKPLFKELNLTTAVDQVRQKGGDSRAAGGLVAGANVSAGCTLGYTSLSVKPCFSIFLC